jgi:hypothetical protein
VYLDSHVHIHGRVAGAPGRQEARWRAAQPWTRAVALELVDGAGSRGAIRGPKQGVLLRPALRRR